MIRDAVPADVPELLRMGREFAEAAGQPEVDDDTLGKTLMHLMSDGILKVAAGRGICGVIGALVFPNFWNESELIAQELFWWVDKPARGTSAGIRLLNAAEEEAKRMGAKKLLMLCLDDLGGDRVAEIYRRCGYEPQERTYRKVL